jgi:2,3-bisphosphoglycerate-dependent phosphoglycerate mutase
MDASERWPRRLLLFRHAESSGNVARDAAESGGRAWIEIADRDMDVGLSERGIEQARAVGEWLGRSDSPTPDVIIASPYRRAADTATVALEASALSVPMVLDERLREREFGVLDRLTKQGILERYPEEAEARSRVGKFYYRPPSGESWCDVALRVRSAIDTIAREHAGATVVVVAHQVVILMFRYVLEHLSEAEVLAIGAEAELLNCSITSYSVDPRAQSHMRLDEYNAAIALEKEDAPLTREADVPLAPR